MHFSVTAIPVPSAPKPLISLRRPSWAPGVSLGLKVRQVVVCSRKPFSRACWHLAMTHKRSCAPASHICRLLSLRGKIGATQGGSHFFFFHLHPIKRGKRKGEGACMRVNNKEAGVCIYGFTQALTSGPVREHIISTSSSSTLTYALILWVGCDCCEYVLTVTEKILPAESNQMEVSVFRSILSERRGRRFHLRRK